MKQRLKYLLLCLIGTIPYLGVAQLSFISGYSGGYLQLDSYENIVDLRNSNLNDPTRTFNDFNFVNGINFGLNYRAEVISLELLWIERFRIMKEQERDPVTNDRLAETTLTERFSGPSFGLNFHLDKLLVGGAVSYNSFRQRTRIDRGEREVILDIGTWGAQVHLGYFGRLNRTSALSVQPYYYFAFNTIDLTEFDEVLNGNSSRMPQADFSHFGIRVFLHNGPQRN